MNLLQKRASFYELVRIERVKHEFDDLEFNPSTALLMLDDIYKIDLELIDLKQDMYRDLLDISDKLPDLDILKAIKPVELVDKIQPIKAVYVWSSALDTLGAEFVNEYCQLNGFNRVIISAKPEADYMKKLNDFISKTGADVELLIGRNKLLLEGSIVSYLDSIRKQCDFGKVKAIHLDIEPHAMDEYKTNKEMILGRYKSLMGQIVRCRDPQQRSFLIERLADLLYSLVPTTENNLSYIIIDPNEPLNVEPISLKVGFIR